MNKVSCISRFFALTFSILALASCTLVGTYDLVVDKNINDVAIKTETVLAKADQGNLTKAEQENFFAETLGTVRTTRARAGLAPKNEDETEALRNLEDRLKALEQRNRPLRRSVATGLLLTLVDLQQIQTTKKRGAAFEKNLGDSE